MLALLAELVTGEVGAAEVLFIIAFVVSVIAVGAALARRVYDEVYVALALSALSLGWVFL